MDEKTRSARFGYPKHLSLRFPSSTEINFTSVSRGGKKCLTNKVKPIPPAQVLSDEGSKDALRLNRDLVWWFVLRL